MNKQITRHFNDLYFTVIATPDEYVVEYVIYDHEGRKENGEPAYPKKDCISHPSPVETVEESEPFIHGAVKYDGCSNWHFDEQDRCKLHGCDKDDLLRFGLILAECWEWTKELCPNWQGNE